MVIPILRSVAKVVASVATCAVAVPTAGGMILNGLGFTAVGPAAGSYAAAWMSSLAIANGGGVAAGSLYAAAQATAMGGGLLVGAPAVLAVGAVAGTVVLIASL